MIFFKCLNERKSIRLGSRACFRTGTSRKLFLIAAEGSEGRAGSCGLEATFGGHFGGN